MGIGGSAQARAFNLDGSSHQGFVAKGVDDFAGDGSAGLREGEQAEEKGS